MMAYISPNIPAPEILDQIIRNLRNDTPLYHQVRFIRESLGLTHTQAENLQAWFRRQAWLQEIYWGRPGTEKHQRRRFADGKDLAKSAGNFRRCKAKHRGATGTFYISGEVRSSAQAAWHDVTARMYAGRLEHSQCDCADANGAYHCKHAAALAARFLARSGAGKETS